ncbi:unnamed protein product [Anisakis simplex]|uniref:EF-hand domain-containing protein n=1 Tax=Anisakis simplex TaxID=6269 RepID=A0A3P6NMQ3_ANISI|nr:unnamed protein product [Anisakis simplex]
MDHDGSLSASECYALLAVLKQCSAGQLRNLFCRSDADSSGTLGRAEFEEFLKRLSPSLFDATKNERNDDLEYFHQQVLSMTPQTEYDEEEESNGFEMIEHRPRPNDIPIRSEEDARRVLNKHARNVSILVQADLDSNQLANFTETLRLVSTYQKCKMLASGHLQEHKRIRSYENW